MNPQDNPVPSGSADPTSFGKPKSDAASAVSSARDAASNFAESAKSSVSEYASGGAQAIRDGAQAVSNIVEEQKQAGAAAVGDVARSARQAAEGLEERSPRLASAVRGAADGVENFSNMVRDNSAGDLMASIGEFAGRKPLAFFGCGVLAGLVLSRLLNSSER
jgi:hypothetical protein